MYNEDIYRFLKISEKDKDFINEILLELEKTTIETLLFENNIEKIRYYQGYINGIRDFKYNISEEKLLSRVKYD